METPILKIGRNEIPIKVGDYFIDNMNCIMLNSGDGRTLFTFKINTTQGWTKDKRNYITLHEKAKRQLGFDKNINQRFGDWKSVKSMDVYLYKLTITENNIAELADLLSRKTPKKKKDKSVVKELKVWNGIWEGKYHINIAAKSLKRAAQLISLYATKGKRDDIVKTRHLRDYFSDTWGDTMKGMPRTEEGIWDDKKKQLYP